MPEGGFLDQLSKFVGWLVGGLVEVVGCAMRAWVGPLVVAWVAAWHALLP